MYPNIEIKIIYEKKFDFKKIKIEIFGDISEIKKYEDIKLLKNEILKKLKKGENNG